MHYNCNPFAPQDDTPVNVLMNPDPAATTKQALTIKPDLFTLPDDCTFGEVLIVDNRREIMEFINRNHGKDTWSRHVSDDEMDYLTEANNVSFYGIRWKGMLVSLMSMELFDVVVYDKTYKAAFVDYDTVHPKFRKTGIHNLMMAFAYQETINRGCVMEFFTGHTKIDCKACMIKPSYLYPLSSTPYACSLTKNQSTVPFKVHKQTLKKVTADDVKLLNVKKEFDVYLTYDDTMISAMLKHYKIYTNGKCVLCFVPATYTVNNITVKYAVLVDWVNLSCAVFKEAVEELRNDGFDTISFTNEGELKELTMNIPFEKKNDVYYYTMNILPKSRKGRINLTVR